MYKRILLLFFVLFLYSCTEDKSLQEITLTLEEQLLEFDPAGETKSIRVSTNYLAGLTLHLEEEAKSWCSVKKENQNIIITTQKNETGEQRNTLLTITVGNKEALVTITQGYIVSDIP